MSGRSSIVTRSGCTRFKIGVRFVVFRSFRMVILRPKRPKSFGSDHTICRPIVPNTTSGSQVYTFLPFLKDTSIFTQKNTSLPPLRRRLGSNKGFTQGVLPSRVACTTYPRMPACCLSIDFTSTSMYPNAVSIRKSASRRVSQPKLGLVTSSPAFVRVLNT